MNMEALSIAQNGQKLIIVDDYLLLTFTKTKQKQGIKKQQQRQPQTKPNQIKSNQTKN